MHHTRWLFREGKAAISREVAEVFERLGTSAETWRARLQKLRQGRLLWRVFAASRAVPRSRPAPWARAGSAPLDGCPAG